MRRCRAVPARYPLVSGAAILPGPRVHSERRVRQLGGHLMVYSHPDMDLLSALSEVPRTGEVLADELGVSRAAISKAARSLAAEGFPVLVERPAGYRLAHGTPTPAALSAVLRGSFGKEYRYAGTVGSTQDVLREWMASGAPNGSVVLAEMQSDGRGRRGRSWESTPGHGLTFSVGLRPTMPVSALGVLSLAAGVAIADAIGCGSSLKWPNDVLAPDGQKLAGILAESQTTGEEIDAVLIGIGINVHAPSAGASVDELDPAVTRVAILANVLSALERWADVTATEPKSVLEAWRGRTTMLGTTVGATTATGTTYGVAEDLDATGALLIRTDDGTVAVHAGDVVQMERPKETS